MFFLISLIFSFFDPCVALCMEQKCTHLLKADGETPILHPTTGEPLKDWVTKKSEFVVAVEAVERLATKASTDTGTSAPNPNPSSNSNCKECK